MSSVNPDELELTENRVRHLTATDLDVPAPSATAPIVPSGATPTLNFSALDDDDPVLVSVEDLLQTYGGVIFVGPPGTSKSWYAVQVGLALVDGDQNRLRLIQFHPSYQYEDFIEGFVPVEGAGGGFVLTDKHFKDMCAIASELPDDDFAVLVIDELSRGDPGRVFGEALTYVEASKRGMAFKLASGRNCVVPTNLVILATMNPLDRGVDEVDAAFERRFAKIRMEPDENLVDRFLADAGMGDALRARVVRFFRDVNRLRRSNPQAALGHTYFIGVSDEDGLRRLWEHQLRFLFDGAYRLDPDGRDAVYRMWDRVLITAASEGAPADNGGEPPPDAEPDEAG